MSRPVLLIAGGSRGIGAATASLPARAAMTSRSTTKAMPRPRPSVVEAVKAAGGKAVAMQGDMARRRPTSSACSSAAAKELGPLTHFVHCAGIIGPYSRLDEADAQMMREVIEVDTLGALLCLRACVRRMSTKHGGKGGSVVMLSSMAAIIGGAGECVWYAAAKGAVDSHGRSACRAKSPRRHAGQRHHARRDRHRHSAAWPGRAGRADAADGQGGAGRTKWPRPSCSCCRMPPPTSTARICACRARASDAIACACRLAAYDPRRNPPTQQTSLLRE